MREKLNENPLIQAVVIGVLALVVVFLFMTNMGGGGGDTAPSGSPVSTDPSAPATDASGQVVAPPGQTFDAPTAQQEAGAQAVLGNVAPDSFVVGPGLPAGVVKAYADGKVVVLLITRQKGIDDRRLKAQVDLLRGHPDIALFETNAKHVARYSRITNGVDVNRTPAMVVMKPRSSTQGEIPIGSVSYGFRGPGSIAQAVDDALYEGKTNKPYYPQ